MVVRLLLLQNNPKEWLVGAMCWFVVVFLIVLSFIGIIFRDSAHSVA